MKTKKVPADMVLFSEPEMRFLREAVQFYLAVRKPQGQLCDFYEMLEDKIEKTLMLRRETLASQNGWHDHDDEDDKHD